MDKDRRFLERRLRRVARRLRWISAANGARAGLVIGAACALGAALLTRVIAPLPAPHVCAALAGVGLIGGFLLGLVRPISLRDAAIRADLQAGTEEVISTAYELRDDAFAPVNLSRAVDIMKTVPPKRFRPRLPLRAPIVPLILLAVAAGLLLLPTLNLGGSGGDTPANLSAMKLAALERDTKKLKRLAEETGDSNLKAMHAEMRKLVRDIRAGKVNKKEALAKLAEISRDAENVKKDLERRGKAMDALEKNAQTKSFAEAASKSDMGAAKEEARKLADKIGSGGLSEGEKEGLSSAMDKLAEQGDPELSEAASSARDALESGDGSSFEKSMGKIAENLKGSAGSGKMGKGSASKRLSDAMSGASDAMDELSGGDDLASEKDFCPECGKRKESQKKGGG
ncbi:MAG: hypothetical protein ACYTAF_10110 [Planctomycetota bacterium]|jgi:hypothetical protein